MQACFKEIALEIEKFDHIMNVVSMQKIDPLILGGHHDLEHETMIESKSQSLNLSRCVLSKRSGLSRSFEICIVLEEELGTDPLPMLADGE